MKINFKQIVPAALVSVFCFSPRIALAAPANLDYFKQFLYTESADDSNADGPRAAHFFLNSGISLQFALDDGSKLLPTAHLYLFSDFTYAFIYRESVQRGEDFLSHGCKRLVGHWSVLDNSLVLDSWAVGQRGPDGDNGIRLTFTKALLNPAFAGKSIDYSFAPSNLGPAEDVCASAFAM